MSLCQRADGRWIVRYKENGTWKQKAFRSQEEARAFDREQSDALLNTNRMTVLEAVVAYMHNVPHSAKRIKACKWALLEGYAVELKDRYVDTLTRRDLEAMREACRVAGLKAPTINWYTGMLRAAFNWCAEQDFLADNPWRKYRDLPERHASHAGTLEDFLRIYPCLPPWLQWAAKTAIALCLRPGIKELFALRWTAFNWPAGYVEVYMPKVKEHKRVYPPAAYLTEAAERRAAAQESDLVCPGPRGAECSTYYRVAWRRACKKAGVLPMPMYALRHIAASRMLAAGADIAAVAAQLGHRNITTTGTFYIHAVSGAQRKAGSFLDLVQNQDLVQTNPTKTAG